MVGDIYFATTEGGLVTNRDVAKMAFVVNGDYVDEDNLDEVREYTKKCRGITKEVNPSIKMCLRNHEKVRAIMIYRDRHPGIGLKEAKDAIDMIEAKMKARREIQQLNKITLGNGDIMATYPEEICLDKRKLDNAFLI